MMSLRTRFKVVYALLLLASGSGTTTAEGFLEDWEISGSNTGRASVYDASGPGAGSPFPFEGDMYFNEFNVYFNKSDSDYASWRGEVSGVYNLNDDFRAVDFGLVPERLNLTRESGESVLPYRAEVGDYFSYYSFLTLQRSLKGIQLELQPFASRRQQHSIVITSGANESNWRDLTPTDDYFNGVSWLMQDSQWGAWNINFVHNFRDNIFRQGTLDRSQYVLSLAGEVPFRLGGNELTIEGEAAHFNGDHDGISGAAGGQDRAGNGYLLELRGQHRSLPWDYRARFESYDQDFRPRGAVVTPDRRSAEVHAGWSFRSGLRLRARAQRFEDGFETGNELTTRTYGLTLTGPLLLSLYPDLNGTLNAYIQNRDNVLGSIGQLSQTVDLNVSMPLPSDWSGRVGVFIQNVNDTGTGNADNLTRQLRLGADHDFDLLGWRGYITPGLVFRTIRRGSQDSNDWQPAVAVRMNRNNHSLVLDYGSLVQNRQVQVNDTDIATHTFNIDYRYRYRQHQFGLETNLFSRNPQPGESTEAYRVSLYWRMDFDKPSSSRLAARTAGPVTGQAASPDGALAVDFRRLAPGTGSEQINEYLAGMDLPAASQQAGSLVYEIPVIRDIFRRQRLVLQYADGLLYRSGFVIDLDDVGDRDTISQLFERVRQSLIREFGRPARTFEDGEFTAALIEDVNEERFIRIIEWETPQGILRFGIPRRLDGQVRMELQHTPVAQPPRETLWSLDAVR